MSDTQPEIQWFIQIADGKKAGPISWERLKKFAEQKKLLPSTKIRNTLPDAVWVLAETIPDLFDNVAEHALPTPITTSEITTATQNTEEKIKSAEKKETSSVSFSINTGIEQTKTNIAAKPIIKIDTKKSVPKENKEEKKSTGIFGFGVPKSPTKTDEKKNEAPKIETSLKTSEPEKKKTSDQSAPAIKISINQPKEKDKNKNKEKSSVPASFVISTEPTPEEPILREELSPNVFLESEELPESHESDENIVKTTETTDTNLKKYGKQQTIPTFSKRKTGIIPLLLITLAVFSILTGGMGGVGIFLLGYQHQLAVFSATLGTIIFLFGIVLGTVSWLLALLFNQSEP
ncbi:MAG: hypothetical protein LBI18_16010 [Planctomycetaceae bacterium]|jgi:hypothetical protein|nr:hypothetical protein [Planctomycetaceae bacterium]